MERPFIHQYFSAFKKKIFCVSAFSFPIPAVNNVTINSPLFLIIVVIVVLCSIVFFSDREIEKKKEIPENMNLVKKMTLKHLTRL